MWQPRARCGATDDQLPIGCRAATNQPTRFTVDHRRRTNCEATEVGMSRVQRSLVSVDAMLDAFYARYVAACAAWSIAPLSHAELRALIDTLIERAGATVQ